MYVHVYSTCMYIGLFVVVLHHQALLYLITIKPHDINTQPTNHIV